MYEYDVDENNQIDLREFKEFMHDLIRKELAEE